MRVSNKQALATPDASANSHPSNTRNAVWRLVRVLKENFMKVQVMRPMLTGLRDGELTCINGNGVSGYFMQVALANGHELPVRSIGPAGGVNSTMAHDLM